MGLVIKRNYFHFTHHLFTLPMVSPEKIISFVPKKLCQLRERFNRSTLPYCNTVNPFRLSSLEPPVSPHGFFIQLGFFPSPGEHGFYSDSRHQTRNAINWGYGWAILSTNQCSLTSAQKTLPTRQNVH